MLEKNKIGRLCEWAVVVIVFVLINIIARNLQEPITYHNGRGWDGRFYYSVAEQFAEGKRPESASPFVYRIGTPFLVSLFFKNNIIFGFGIINIIANAIAVLLLVIWLRLFLTDWKIRLVLVLMFIMQWQGPVRFVHFYPVYTDPWSFVFLLSGLIGVYHVKLEPKLQAIIYVGLITFFGIIFRETIFIIPLALLFTGNPFDEERNLFSRISSLQFFKIFKMPPARFFLPILFAVAGMVLVRLTVIRINNYSFLLSWSSFAYKKLLLTYIHAYFFAFGPLIVIAIYNWRRNREFLRNNQYLGFYLIAFMFASWVGGTDTERYLYSAMPVVYLLIGKSIEDTRLPLRSAPLIAVLVLSQILSQRLFWTIPDFPNTFTTPLPVFTILSSKCQYYDLWSHYCERIIRAFSFLEYLLLGAVLLLWLKYRELQQSKSNPVP